MLTQERGIYTKLEVICRGRVHPTQFLPLRPYNTHSFPRFYPPLHRTGLVPALCTCKLARNDQTTALSACTRILNEFIEYISCFLSYLALWDSTEIGKKEILLYKRTAIYLIGHCFIFFCKCMPYFVSRNLYFCLKMYNWFNNLNSNLYLFW